MSDPILKDVILLYLNPYGQFTAEEISDFIGYPSGYLIDELLKENLITYCEMWDSYEGVSAGTSDKLALTETGRDKCLEIQRYQVDEWIHAPNHSVMAYWYLLKNADVKRLEVDKVLFTECKKRYDSAHSELLAVQSDYNTLFERAKSLERKLKALESQNTALIKVMCVSADALEIATNISTTSNAEKSGQMRLISRLLMDAVNNRDISNQDIPF